MIIQTLLFVILCVWIHRVFLMARFRRLNPPLEPLGASALGIPPPKVSVIIPARNEEKNIANCLSHFFKTDYPNFEILVVDDRSEDRTPHLVENFRRLSPVPFRVITLGKLPQGWTGKNYAMQAGSRIASGEWLLFTDADTTHSPQSIATAVREALAKKIDFLTLAPETEAFSFWEKTIQPLAVGSLAIWFDPQKNNDPKSDLVLANGQFILVRKEAYRAVGGNEVVKNKVVEDVELARKMRQAGYRVQMLNGTRLYRTRMYTSLKEIQTGWTRIFAHLFGKNIFRLIEKIAMFLFFSILPFGVLTAEIFWALNHSAYFSKNIFFLSLSVSGLIITVRFIGNRLLRSDPWYAFLHPLGSAVMVWILLVSATRVIWRRPSVWKGEKYT